MDPTAAQLLRRYLLAGVMIAAGVVAGAVAGQRQHEAEFPERAAVAVPCVEACAKRASCTGQATSDTQRCSVLCQVRAGSHPTEAFQESRCLIEHGCAELAACSPPW